MDAAHYISTLDQLPVVPGEPDNAAFAIVDLAGTPDFLKGLYAAMANGHIRWVSLLEGTRWQSGWQAGPILVEMSDRPDVQKLAAGKLADAGVGLVIDCNQSFDDMIAWGRSRLLALAESDERLFRFYEPRSMKPLLAVLGDKASTLFPPESTIYWHDSQRWMNRETGPLQSTDEALREWKLSQAELAGLPDYRQAQRACQLAEVYRDHIGQAGDPRIWTLERLHEATAHGCSKVSQQERWLRIALQIDTPILSEPTLRNLAVNAEMPAEDRLIAMERFVESEHATA